MDPKDNVPATAKLKPWTTVALSGTVVFALDCADETSVAAKISAAPKSNLVIADDIFTFLLIEISRKTFSILYICLSKYSLLADELGQASCHKKTQNFSKRTPYFKLRGAKLQIRNQKHNSRYIPSENNLK